jgi:GT2 family glycosyltransferase
VRALSREYPFITLVRLESGEKRDFNSKVYAFRAGYTAVKSDEHGFVGNLDADVTFEPDYYERMLKAFDTDKSLGIASGWVRERQNGRFEPRPRNRTHVVPGAAQFFRRECYEQTGGYEPVSRGGEDTVICLRAEMHGWNVRAFPEIPLYHHRFTGAGQGGALRASFQNGMLEYGARNHPAFELFKFVFRLTENPFLIGSAARLCGIRLGGGETVAAASSE